MIALLAIGCVLPAPESPPNPAPPAPAPCSWGFADSEQWSLPSPFGITGFEDQYAGLEGTSPVDYTARLDWTGDGAPDLLVAQARVDEPVVPPDVFWVYEGKHQGFDQGLQAWEFPSGAVAGGWSAVDLDGDGVGEVVVTSGVDPALGNTAWDVYTAFSDAPTRIALPAGFPDYSFTSLAAGVGFLADLVGDARLDLVAYPDAGGDALAWTVYRGGPDGFGAPAPFVLPAMPENAYATSTWECSNGRIGAFQLADLDGDGVVELVRTSDCADPSIGSSHWAVHRNLSTGFDPTAEELTLPFSVLADEEEGCGAADLADADVDGFLDLVVTARCDDPSVGASHIEVYPGSKDGFGAAQSWDLPSDWPQRSMGLAWSEDCDDLDNHGQVTDRQTALFPLRGSSLFAMQLDACDDLGIGNAYWLTSESACL